MNEYDIKLLKQERDHLKAFNEVLHTKYKEDIVDVINKNKLRDHFAGLAMQAIISKHYHNNDVSALAYEHADAMLKAREGDDDE